MTNESAQTWIGISVQDNMVVKLQSARREEDSFESEVFAGIAMAKANIPGVVRVLGYKKYYDEHTHAIIFERAGRYSVDDVLGVRLL